MGLFRAAGRQVEQFKRSVTASAEADADYECEECVARFDAHDGRCPECGSGEVTQTAAER